MAVIINEEPRELSYIEELRERGLRRRAEELRAAEQRRREAARQQERFEAEAAGVEGEIVGRAAGTAADRRAEEDRLARLGMISAAADREDREDRRETLRGSTVESFVERNPVIYQRNDDDTWSPFPAEDYARRNISGAGRSPYHRATNLRRSRERVADTLASEEFAVAPPPGALVVPPARWTDEISPGFRQGFAGGLGLQTATPRTGGEAVDLLTPGSTVVQGAYAGRRDTVNPYEVPRGYEYALAPLDVAPVPARGAGRLGGRVIGYYRRGTRYRDPQTGAVLDFEGRPIGGPPGGRGPGHGAIPMEQLFVPRERPAVPMEQVFVPRRSSGGAVPIEEIYAPREPLGGRGPGHGGPERSPGGVILPDGPETGRPAGGGRTAVAERTATQQTPLVFPETAPQTGRRSTLTFPEPAPEVAAPPARTTAPGRSASLFPGVAPAGPDTRPESARAADYEVGETLPAPAVDAYAPTAAGRRIVQQEESGYGLDEAPDVRTRRETAPARESRLADEAATGTRLRNETRLDDETGLREETRLRDETGLRTGDETRLREETRLRDETGIRTEDITGRGKRRFVRRPESLPAPDAYRTGRRFVPRETVETLNPRTVQWESHNLHTLDTETGEHTTEMISNRQQETARVRRFVKREPPPGDRVAGNARVTNSGGRINVRPIAFRSRQAGRPGQDGGRRGNRDDDPGQQVGVRLVKRDQ